MKSQWQPFQEPLRMTLLRNGTISILVGAAVARFWGGLARWPLMTLLVLWPALGGHWLEVCYLNWLRPRLAPTRGVQVVARVAVWFLGGIGFAFAMRLTATALSDFRPAHWPEWWLAGVALIFIELVAHLVLQLRRRPSFYNGRG
jgi:hypothetical protein